jgi:hypothetical protein
MRYQEWWFYIFPLQLSHRGFEVRTLGKSFLVNTRWVERMTDPSKFSPLDEALLFEAEQIKEYTNLKLHEDDILFHTDLSFPGLFHNILFHKRPNKCFCFCHATSINYLDYFEKDRVIKFPIEKETASLYDMIFVGSNYHASKLLLDNMIVTYLPFPPFTAKTSKRKKQDIISVARNNPQKVDLEVENKVEKKISKIARLENHSWPDYYQNIADSKVMLITAKEETFGYQVVDAVLNKCIPIAPNRFSYPELLDSKYLYNDEDELMSKLKFFIKNYKKESEGVDLKCGDKMRGFYNKIIKVMKNAI